MILTESSMIYGKDYGKIYLCTNCNAFTGVHKNSDKPLGTLANSILRTKRKEERRGISGLQEKWDCLLRQRTLDILR